MCPREGETSTLFAHGETWGGGEGRSGGHPRQSKGLAASHSSGALQGLWEENEGALSSSSTLLTQTHFPFVYFNELRKIEETKEKYFLAQFFLCHLPYFLLFLFFCFTLKKKRSLHM